MHYHGKIHGYRSYETGNIDIPNQQNTTLRFHSTFYDFKGPPVNSADQNLTIGKHNPSIDLYDQIKVTPSISSITINSNQTATANMLIKLKGPQINITNLSSHLQGTLTKGERENLIIKAIDNNNNNITENPGSFHNLTTSVSLLDFGSFDAMIGNDTNDDINHKPYSIILKGSTWTYPLDQYKSNLIISIPFKNVAIKPHIDHETFEDHNINFKINGIPKGEGTDIVIKTDIERIPYLNWAIIFPIIFVFFLLGAICFLEPAGHYLVARIAITLGVFAFVFAFDTILSGIEPHAIIHSSTFTNILLKLVLVAAIASTISSVIGYSIKMDTVLKKRWKRIHKIVKFPLYDVFGVVSVIVFALILGIRVTDTNLRFDLMIILILIVVGLLWGLFSHIVRHFILRQKKALPHP